MNQVPDSSSFDDVRPVATWERPTRLSAAIFQTKVTLFQMRRAVINLGSGVGRLPRVTPEGFPVMLMELRSPLWCDERLAERVHQLGKVENLRRAARALDGAHLAAGSVFSFWKQVGRASARRGFVTGRMLQQGCLTPAVGGGLCQISNALYNLALDTGCEVLERHAHSRVVPGSASTAGRDATVAWNYVDLRFRSHRPRRLEVRLSANELIVRLWGEAGETPVAAARPAPTVKTAPAAMPGGPVPRSCATCDETSCFRHEKTAPVVAAEGVTAWLMDDNSAEFRRYLYNSRAEGDLLGLPLDGARWGMARYRWPTGGFSRVADAPAAALLRSFNVRRNRSSGPLRRQAEIAGAEAIARRLSRLLTHDIGHAVVAQSLLPFLWREGWLGGRRFSVLATRPPMAHLQGVLDVAARAHPQRASLSDFRAPPDVVAAEAEAMTAAESIITPHSEVARMFHRKAVLLDWIAPTAQGPKRPQHAPRRIAFPGPTAARKGAWAVREAAQALDLEVLLPGSELEGADFWAGVKTVRPTNPDPDSWLASVAAVVQPALTEESPPLLVKALSARTPVLASAACGLSPHKHLELIAADNADALIAALRKHAGLG